MCCAVGQVLLGLPVLIGVHGHALSPVPWLPPLEAALAHLAIAWAEPRDATGAASGLGARLTGTTTSATRERRIVRAWWHCQQTEWGGSTGPRQTWQTPGPGGNGGMRKLA